VGRYAESDPIGVIDGPNTYTHARSMPIGAYDSFGLASKSACCQDVLELDSYVRTYALGFPACCDGKLVACDNYDYDFGATP
jgi:hypothetical protein